jgi:uncharacterized protein YcsI (UPF0317 family)
VWFCRSTTLPEFGSFLSSTDNSIPGFWTCERVTPELVSKYWGARAAAAARRFIGILEELP